jgi:branched-chain amino acid transport system substrate-binding protein
MSEIRILDFTPSHNLGKVTVSIKIATIDDTNGNTIVAAYEVARGELNIQPLIDRNKEVIEAFHTRTSGQRYFGKKTTFGIDMSHPQRNQVFEETQQELIQFVIEFRNLLDRSLQEDFWNQIREKLIISLNNTSHQKIRLVIRTDLKDIQDLPVESASFITKVLTAQNPLTNINVVFAPKAISQKIRATQLFWDGTPRVLLVIGNQAEIISPITLTEIKNFFLSPANFTPLIQPSWDELRRTIANHKFDVIIIIGHSRSEAAGIDGSITINNQSELVSIKDFTEPFKNSIANGLKAVILGGCTSIGLARALVAPEIGVANVISCRMPVHYEALRLLLEELLTKWTSNNQPQSLESALTETRRTLTALDSKHPGSSLLPILLSTLPDAPPLMFPLENSAVSTKSNSWRTISWICLIATAFTTAFYLLKLPRQLEPTCNSIIGDGISCGEEIFTREPNVSIQDDKQAGANAIAAGKHTEAVQLLTQAWAEKKDPETLIMLENSKVAIGSLPIKTIALSIPGSQSTPPDISTGMLKAVGYAQQQWNAHPQHLWKLQIVLVDDRNDRTIAPSLSDRLLNRKILAGIGNYSSAVTTETKDVYKKHQTVLISGSSTATTLIDPNSGTFFFRVCSNNLLSGKQISAYLQRYNYKNIALFHTAGKPFSDSMVSALKENSPSINIIDFNFADKGLAIDRLNEARKAGAQAIFLVPDAYTSTDPERLRLLSIIRENNGDLPIIGNEVVKDPILLNYSKKQIEKIVISLPWHPSSIQTKTIDFPSFWGKPEQLDHRLAMNYDATQVLIKAIDLLPVNQSIDDSRQQIQKILSNPTFSIDGITGKISFTGSERTQQQNIIVTPKCDENICKGFKPVI